jgi:hypothetical protein
MAWLLLSSPLFLLSLLYGAFGMVPFIGCASDTHIGCASDAHLMGTCMDRCYIICILAYYIACVFSEIKGKVNSSVCVYRFSMYHIS